MTAVELHDPDRVVFRCDADGCHSMYQAFPRDIKAYDGPRDFMVHYCRWSYVLDGLGEIKDYCYHCARDRGMISHIPKPRIPRMK